MVIDREEVATDRRYARTGWMSISSQGRQGTKAVFSVGDAADDGSRAVPSRRTGGYICSVSG
jgi:hypothetical protein